MVTFDVGEGHVTHVWLMLNPTKLTNWPLD
jgi:RNA polymerase sigma-70 factor (ECF subfamily)